MATYRLSLTEILLGAAASGIAVKIARPVLVAALRAGFKTQAMAQETWSKTKAELDQVMASARGEEVQARGSTGAAASSGTPVKAAAQPPSGAALARDA